jgi:hypothetical protein
MLERRDIDEKNRCNFGFFGFVLDNPLRPGGRQPLLRRPETQAACKHRRPYGNADDKTRVYYVEANVLMNVKA